MSRQRLRPSLGEASAVVCPRCEGRGNIRDVQSSALHVLRYIQEEAMKENTAALHVHLPVDTATFLLNEKRHEIGAIEARLGTPVLILPDPEMETPHYHIRRLRSEEYDAEIDTPSYEVEFVEAEEAEPRHHGRPAPVPITGEKPAVQEIAHAPPPARAAAKPEPGIFAKFMKLRFGGEEPVVTKTPAPAPARGPRPQHARGPHPQRRPEHRDNNHRGEHRGPRPPQRNSQPPRPPAAPRPEARPEHRPAPAPVAAAVEPPQPPVPGTERPARPEGTTTGRRRRRGRRGRGAGARPPQEGAQRSENLVETTNQANHHDEHHASEVERGNEALPASEHRWEEPAHEHHESQPTVSTEPAVTAHVPTTPPAPIAPAEAQPVSTEPKIP